MDESIKPLKRKDEIMDTEPMSKLPLSSIIISEDPVERAENIKESSITDKLEQIINKPISVNPCLANEV